MIPLKDVDRKPARFPLITMLIIGANTFIYLIEVMEGGDFVRRWSMVPVEISAGKHLVTVVTAMFLHGSLLHIAGNMIFFWAFGPEVEDMMGRVRYAIFYLVGGIIAFGVQIGLNPVAHVPTLGASGAIATIMAAFLVTFPRDRIRTVIFLGIFVTIYLIPAVVLVGIWFLLQIVSEAGTFAGNQSHGGVAYGAHIGGFLFGLAFARLFERGRPDGPGLSPTDFIDRRES
jgi:membrane associated rhomboid family serine protease